MIIGEQSVDLLAMASLGPGVSNNITPVKFPRQYVLTYITDENENVIFVRKIKPDWQRGLLNLPGGKVEENENAFFAATRELFEETGIIYRRCPHLCGKIVGTDWLVFVFNLGKTDQTPEQKTDEQIVITNYKSVKDSKNLMNNLRVIIPLCQAEFDGWTIRCEDGRNDKLTVEGLSR